MVKILFTLGTISLVATSGIRSIPLESTSDPSSTLAYAPVVGAAEGLPVFEGATCVLCPNCGPENFHRAFAYANGYKSGEHESCLNAGYSGECPGHARCGGDEMLLSPRLERLESLFREGAEGSPNAIVLLTTEFPSHIVLVPERSALQVTLCGSIVGHLTLSSSTFAAALHALPGAAVAEAPAP